MITRNAMLIGLFASTSIAAPPAPTQCENGGCGEGVAESAVGFAESPAEFAAGSPHFSAPPPDSAAASLTASGPFGMTTGTTEISSTNEGGAPGQCNETICVIDPSSQTLPNRGAISPSIGWLLGALAELGDWLRATAENWATWAAEARVAPIPDGPC